MSHALSTTRSALALITLLLLTPGITRGESDDQWNMAWHDEFDRDGTPDPANWGFEHGFVRNDELQYYTRENAVCRGGMLIIEARREHRPNPDFHPGASGWKNRQWIEYTSASLTTRRKHEFTFGKFEMRARIDTRQGSWPAFWTLGATPGVRWPDCGEVDVMEYYRQTVLANVCYGVEGRQRWLTTKHPLAELGRDWPGQFHTWTMLWDPHRIDLLLDGKAMAHFDVDAADKNVAPNPFRRPQYLILNQAIGGTQGGDPSSTAFPIRFEVDWVRVYQRKQP